MSFKKLKYTTHYLVVEDEYLAVFYVGLPSSMCDPFLHVAPSRRVDPCIHPLTCGYFVPMRNVSVWAETHVFVPHRDRAAHYLSLSFLLLHSRSYSVSCNMVLNLSIAILCSGNLYRSQTTFRHSNTWRNMIRLHNYQMRHFHEPSIFKQMKLNIICKWIYCSPHLCPHNSLISDDLHIKITVSWLMTLKVDFLQFEGHLSVIEVNTQNFCQVYHCKSVKFKKKKLMIR